MHLYLECEFNNEAVSFPCLPFWIYLLALASYIQLLQAGLVCFLPILMFSGKHTVALFDRLIFRHLNDHTQTQKVLETARLQLENKRLNSETFVRIDTVITMHCAGRQRRVRATV